MTNPIRTASNAIKDDLDALADSIIDCQLKKQPILKLLYGPHQLDRCRQDTKNHLSMLSVSLQLRSLRLFKAYIEWLKVLMTHLQIPLEDVQTNFLCMQEVLQNKLPKERKRVWQEYIEVGLKHFEEAPTDVLPFIDNTKPLSALASQYLNALFYENADKADQFIFDAIKEGISIKDIYIHVFEKTLHEVGRLWQLRKISVAQEHYFSTATYRLMAKLQLYFTIPEKKKHTIVTTCITKELHTIGLQMVTDFFEMEGWNTFYLGANIPTESILQTIIDREADVLAISATMTFHIPEVETMIQTVRASKECQDVRILVGGAPFNTDPELWEHIGADGYAKSAMEAVIMANKLRKRK
jgi:methanogenic corrinoid protein MtbC1